MPFHTSLQTGHLRCLYFLTINDSRACPLCPELLTDKEVMQILHEPGGVREKFTTWISYLANMFDSTAFSLFIIGPALSIYSCIYHIDHMKCSI